MRGDPTSVPTKVLSCCRPGGIEPEKNCGMGFGRGGAATPGAGSAGSQFSGISASVRKYFELSVIASPSRRNLYGQNKRQPKIWPPRWLLWDGWKPAPDCG